MLECRRVVVLVSSVIPRLLKFACVIRFLCWHAILPWHFCHCCTHASWVGLLLWWQMGSNCMWCVDCVCWLCFLDLGALMMSDENPNLRSVYTHYSSLGVMSFFGETTKRQGTGRWSWNTEQLRKAFSVGRYSLALFPQGSFSSSRGRPTTLGGEKTLFHNIAIITWP